MRTCIICGACVRNGNKKSNTCDPICTRARNAGMSRLERLEYEMRRDGRRFAKLHCKVCGKLNSQCFCYDVEGKLKQA